MFLIASTRVEVSGWDETLKWLYSVMLIVLALALAVLEQAVTTEECHMPSLPVQKIHLHDDTAFSTSIIQACLPQ